MPHPEISGSRPVRRQITVVEEATLDMAGSIMSNYKDANLALFDLVDNGIDNRIVGKQLLIHIRFDKNSVAITNTGGEGLDLNGLQEFLRWGVSNKTEAQIGQYGIGGKAAMGFLGKSITINASAKDSELEYTLTDENWTEKTSQATKTHTVEERTAENKDGYFKLSISNLNTARINQSGLEAKLGDTYKPLIERGGVKIYVNGKEVKAPEIKYLISNPEFKPEAVSIQTGFGKPILATVGVLEEGQKIKPGLRCYYRGRLIEEGQFFGMQTPAQFPQASRLFGEVYLDHLPITTNKSDFIKDGAEYKDALYVMQEYLKAWYNKLPKLVIENRAVLEPYEIQLAKEAKRAIEHILSLTEIYTRAQIPGSSTGRLPATKIEDRAQPTGKKRKVGNIEGATPPNKDATKAPTFKRWGPFHNWEPVSMGNEDTRSSIVSEEGRDILRINTDYPLYRAAKKEGRGSLLLYQAETAVTEMCLSDSSLQSPQDFMEKVNTLLKHLGEFLLTRDPDQLNVTPRGRNRFRGES